MISNSVTDDELIREVEHFADRLIPELLRRFEDSKELADKVSALTAERDELLARLSRVENELSLIS